MGKDILLQELKSIQLEILRDVAFFCENNKISYFLCYGTLLGAVRHQGFIPWDDDIDIAIPRPDYNKFIDLYYKDNRKFKVLTNEIDKKYPYGHAKVVANNTIIIELSSNNYKIGVNIDVFPIDGLPSEREELRRHYRKINLLRNCLAMKVVKINKTRAIYKNIFLIISKILLKFVSYRFILCKMDRVFNTYEYEITSFAANLNYGGRDRKIEKYMFESSVLVDFEGDKFRAPIDYKKWLTNIYGDYMKLPDEKQRKSHHRFTAYFID